MSQNKMPIVGFTAPPNGTLEIDHVKSYIGQDFRTRERYAEYKECGFSQILFSGEDKYLGEPFETSDLKRMLDNAAACGLQAIVFDERIMALTVQGKNSVVEEMFGGSREKLFSFVKDCLSAYRHHPAFYGVSVVDEPQVGKAQVLKEVIDAVKNAAPDAFVHTCFLPCIQDLGLVPGAFGYGYDSVWKAYRNYIDKMAGTGIGYFGYDAYPFGMWEGKNVVCAKFIRNMQEVALGCRENGVPFHMTIQSFSSGEFDEIRRVDESDLNWQANLAMGFGCKKIYYFTYWRFTTRTGFNNTSAIIDDDGTRTIYAEAQRNNALIQRTFRHIADLEYECSQLLPAEHDNPATQEMLSEDTGIAESFTADAPVLVTRLGGNGKKAFMFLNVRDPFEKCVNRFSVRLKEKKEVYRALIDGEELLLSAENGSLCFDLKPGEAIWLLFE